MRGSAFRPSLPVRVIMLSAAYAPLLVLVAVLDSFRLAWLRWTLAALAVAGVAGTVLFLVAVVPRRNATIETIYRAKPREGEALRFFATYVVPFFVTATAVAPARWGLGIYLFMIAVLYLQGDMYFSNPLLAAMGYRIFEVDRADRGFLLVISRSWHLAPGETVSLVPLGGYIHLQQTSRRRGPTRSPPPASSPPSPVTPAPPTPTLPTPTLPTPQQPTPTPPPPPTRGRIPP